MSKTNKIILGILAVLVIVFFVVRSTTINKKTDDSGEVIKIGVALGLTGDAAEWGEVAKNGAQLAVNEINNKGGVNGKKIELIIEDTKSTSKDTVSAVSKLQNIDNVSGVLTTWLDVYQGAESVLNEKTIMISPDAGIEAVNGTKIHPRVFSTWYRTEPKSELAVKHMAENGIKKLYIITENDSYYSTVVDFMKKSASKYNIEIVGVEQPNSADSIKTSFLKIKNTNPDAVFFAFYDEQKNYEFLTKYKSFLSPTIKIYGDEFVRQNYTNNKYPQNSFEGIYFYAPKNPDTEFIKKYKSTYNSEPVFGASTAYDAIYMIAKVFEKNPENIDNFMRSQEFNTVSYGNVSFDEIGGVISQENYFEIKQIINGQIN